MKPVSSFQHKGVFALLLTPFTETGVIDWAVYDRYLAWQIGHNPQGLFAVCGSSEMKWLSLEERLKLAERAVQMAAGLPVIATANPADDPAVHEDEMKRLVDTGVSGIVLTPPSGMGADETKLEHYFRTMAEKAGVPVFLYEWPQVDSYFIPSDMYGRLCRDGLIAGIKDTTCTLEGIAAKIDVSTNGAVVYQANTPFLLEGFRRGAKGCQGIISTAYADLAVALWQAFLKNDPEADRLQQDLLCLDAILRFSWPRMAKCLARLRGIPIGPRCRWPGQLSAEAEQAARLFHAAVNRTRNLS